MNWWWCLEHSQAEQGPGCGGTSRLGPYPNPSLAATALKRINHFEAEQREQDEHEQAA